MNYNLKGNDIFPLVEVTLGQGEEILLERGAMVYHDDRIKLEGRMNSSGATGVGGMLKALGRSATSGESFFISHAIGLAEGATIALAPAMIGAIRELEVGQVSWRLNDKSFLACDSTVNYTMKRQKLSQAFLGRTGGLYVMETAGSGHMLISSYGDILEVKVDANNPVVIDNEHVVAWENSLDYSIEVASGTFGFTTGEGLVNKFSGQGTVLIQTRNIHSLASAISPFVSSGS